MIMPSFSRPLKFCIVAALLLLTARCEAAPSTDGTGKGQVDSGSANIVAAAAVGGLHSGYGEDQPSSSSIVHVRRASSYQFDPLAKDLNVVYYGQSNLTGDVSLTQVCSDASIDVVILGFIKSFYTSPEDKSNKKINITMHFRDRCSAATAAQKDAGQPGLLDCVGGDSDSFADEIAGCQQLGKKVLISAGSASGDLYIPDSKAAGKLAKVLWNLFLGGTDKKVKPIRPFGEVVLDGFDLGESSLFSLKIMDFDGSFVWIGV